MNRSEGHEGWGIQGGRLATPEIGQEGESSSLQKNPFCSRTTSFANFHGEPVLYPVPGEPLPPPLPPMVCQMNTSGQNCGNTQHFWRYALKIATGNDYKQRMSYIIHWTIK